MIEFSVKQQTAKGLTLGIDGGKHDASAKLIAQMRVSSLRANCM